MSTAKVLVVDDEPNLVLLVQEWLQEEGYEVCTASNGREALQLFYQHRPDLCIVDLIMPAMDGFQLITRIREVSAVQVLVLTALSNEQHLVRGLNIGADQYLVKPLSRRSLLAHVKAALRRGDVKDDVPSIYRDRSLTLNFLTREVMVRGQAPKLTPTEFRLLGFLCQNRHRVVGHEELLDQVWGSESGSLDSLKWYIHSLREKVEEDPSSPYLILTVPGTGYRYRPDGDES